jgi:acetyl-CoA carboxylase beta subunit
MNLSKDIKKAEKEYKEGKCVKLACPKCGHIINNKDLEHWRCVKCKKSFKVTLK